MIVARQGVLAKRLLAQGGGSVLGGPFRGLRYLSVAHGSVLPAKLLGAYEDVLHPWINAVIGESYDRIVDIGCAEGYYAVGFAFQMPSVAVHAYDINSEAQSMCRELSRLNGVEDRVKVHGECTPQDLQHVLCDAKRPFLLSDCEGFELDLLDLERTSALSKTDMLVELHDMIRPGITNMLRGRFAATHDIAIVDDAIHARHSPDLEALRSWNWMDRRLAIEELRGRGQQWAFFRAIGRE